MAADRWRDLRGENQDGNSRRTVLERPRWAEASPVCGSGSFADLNAYMARALEGVCRLFGEKGAHASTRPGLYFFGDKTLLVDLTAAAPRKGALRLFIREFAAEHDCYAAAMIADTWVTAQAKPLPNQVGRSSQGTQRREAIIAELRVREGSATWIKMCLYQRRDGKMVWQEIDEEEMPAAKPPSWWRPRLKKRLGRWRISSNTISGALKMPTQTLWMAKRLPPRTSLTSLWTLRTLSSQGTCCLAGQNRDVLQSRSRRQAVGRSAGYILETRTRGGIGCRPQASVGAAGQP